MEGPPSSADLLEQMRALDPALLASNPEAASALQIATARAAVVDEQMILRGYFATEGEWVALGECEALQWDNDTLGRYSQDFLVRVYRPAARKMPEFVFATVASPRSAKLRLTKRFAVHGLAPFAKRFVEGELLSEQEAAAVHHWVATHEAKLDQIRDAGKTGLSLSSYLEHVANLSVWHASGDGGRGLYGYPAETDEDFGAMERWVRDLLWPGRANNNNGKTFKSLMEYFIEAGHEQTAVQLAELICFGRPGADPAKMALAAEYLPADRAAEIAGGPTLLQWQQDYEGSFIELLVAVWLF